MKKAIDLLYVTIMTTLISTSCSDASADNYNDSSVVENIAVSKSTIDNNIITFKVNGEQVKTSGWNISRFIIGNKTQLNITSNMHLDKRAISVNLNGDKPGTYALIRGGSTSGCSYGSYAPDYEDLLTRFCFKEGEFTITEVDTVKGIVNATFKGTATNLQGKSFEITDGKIINGELKPGIQKF